MRLSLPSPVGKRPKKVVAEALEDCLNMPRKHARHLAKEWAAEIRTMRMEFEALRVAGDNVPDLAKLVDVTGAADLASYLAHRRCGMVLAGIHYGQYLFGSVAILAALQLNVLILRRKPPGHLEHSVVASARRLGNTRVEFLSTTAKMAFRKALRWLADGGVVLTFFDLPSGWGRCSEVHVFNRRMRWVSGPSEIACRGQALLVPFHVQRPLPSRRSSCVFGEALDFSDHIVGQRTVEDACQVLADMATTVIMKKPEQWHNWPLVPSMTGQP